MSNPTAAQVNTARLTLALIESGPLHYRGKKTPEVRRAVARLVLSVMYPHLAAVLGGKE